MLTLYSQRRRVLNPRPAMRLSRGFIAANGKPAGLWMPTPGLGPKAYDFSGNNNTGTLNGGVTVAPGGFGVLGQAWKTDGTTGYINIPDSPTVNPTAAISLVAVFSLNAYTANGNIFSKGFTSVAPPYVQYSVKQDATVNGKLNFQIGIGGTNNNLTSNATLALNTSYVVVAVYDGSAMRLYINGSPDASVAASGSINVYATPLQIGRWGTQASQYSNFACYLASISGTALSPAQVASLYSALRTGEPYPIFGPSVNDRIYASFAAGPAGGMPWFIGGGMGSFIGCG